MHAVRTKRVNLYVNAVKKKTKSVQSYFRFKKN